jgi:hypothetical protein
MQFDRRLKYVGPICERANWSVWPHMAVIAFVAPDALMNDSFVAQRVTHKGRQRQFA